MSEYSDNPTIHGTDPVMLNARIERASNILRSHTCHGRGVGKVQQDINDAVNVLQWGQTVAEEEAEERKDQPCEQQR